MSVHFKNRRDSRLLFYLKKIHLHPWKTPTNPHLQYGIAFDTGTEPDVGPGDEPNYAGSNRGRIRGRKIERPLLEAARGRRPIEGISPVRKRGLIEVTPTSDGYKNREYMRPKSEH